MFSWFSWQSNLKACCGATDTVNWEYCWKFFVCVCLSKKKCKFIIWSVKWHQEKLLGAKQMKPQDILRNAFANFAQ